eukprot:1857626-Pyramimonas_sp.AAC.1
MIRGSCEERLARWVGRPSACHRPARSRHYAFLEVLQDEACRQLLSSRRGPLSVPGRGRGGTGPAVAAQCPFWRGAFIRLASGGGPFCFSAEKLL